MPCHVLCPECGEGLNEVYEFIDLVKQGYYKKLLDESKVKIHPTKLQLTPDITKPIGFILDLVNLTNICCRSHILGVTNFDLAYA
jgi:DNA-directed RNA polymerase subunit N (RpoN/RPB10)